MSKKKPSTVYVHGPCDDCQRMATELWQAHEDLITIARLRIGVWQMFGDRYLVAARDAFRSWRETIRKQVMRIAEPSANRNNSYWPRESVCCPLCGDMHSAGYAWPLHLERHREGWGAEARPK